MPVWKDECDCSEMPASNMVWAGRFSGGCRWERPLSQHLPPFTSEMLTVLVEGTVPTTIQKVRESALYLRFPRSLRAS